MFLLLLENVLISDGYLSQATRQAIIYHYEICSYLVGSLWQQTSCHSLKQAVKELQKLIGCMRLLKLKLSLECVYKNNLIELELWGEKKLKQGSYSSYQSHPYF